MLLCGGLFAAAMAFFIYLGITNHKELLINNWLHFSVTGASIFYWVMAGLSSLFVIAAILALGSRNSKHSLCLQTNGLSLPQGFMLRKTVFLPYQEITDIQLQHVSGQRFIKLFMANQKTYSINVSFLASKARYAEFITALEEHTACKLQ